MKKISLDRLLIYCTAFLRALGIGMVAVLLAIYLMKEGFTKPEVGIVVSIGLLGGAMGNLFVTFFGDRIGRRKLLLSYAILSAVGAIAFCLTSSFYAILASAFCGMLNARGKDRGSALVLECAILPSLECSGERTKAFAWYSLVQDVGLALGGVIAGLPTMMTHYLSITEIEAMKLSFGLYAVLMVVCAALYCYLSEKTEVPMKKVTFGLSTHGRKVITKLASLFALDSLASGFLTSTLIAYYFYVRFDVPVEAIGILFFFARFLNAISYFGAVWIARKIGLLNAMVFTHIPSHIFLVAIAFAPTFPIAAALYLIREVLVEMDNPTRQSYVMAVVKQEEHTKASGITQMVRMLGWATAPAFAGFVMQEWSNSSPLFIGAGLKITYDLLILISFRKIKPPEEPAQEELKPVVVAA